jgi:hypothetical protein|tara:strand:+ start:175 stop:375 length:201 start_codon:yes stop_codon:yes gene_type:complete
LIDIQTEADRLIALDQTGRDREMVVMALRLGQESQRSWDQLHALDLELIDEFTRCRKGDGGAPEGA